MPIESITFNLRTATALFMHGANNREEVELRPPSIKGVMRFWFRALAGGLASLNELRDLEGKVFGSTDADKGSRLMVRVARQATSSREFSLLPHKSGPARPAFPAGELFDVILALHPGVKDTSYLDAAAWSLWVAANLGGFGQRARRGAGSLGLQKVEPAVVGMPVADRFADANALKQHLENGLTAAKTCLRRLITDPASGTASPVGFGVLTASTARIVIGKIGATNEQDARKQVMELRNQADPSHKNRAFGGPQPRLASPLHVHLHPDGKQGWWAVATWFKDPAYGNGGLVQNFLSKLKGSKGAEVDVP